MARARPACWVVSPEGSSSRRRTPREVSYTRAMARCARAAAVASAWLSAPPTAAMVVACTLASATTRRRHRSASRWSPFADADAARLSASAIRRAGVRQSSGGARDGELGARREGLDAGRGVDSGDHAGRGRRGEDAMTRVAPRRRLLPRDLRRILLDEHNGQLARMPTKTRDARHPRKRAPPAAPEGPDGARARPRGVDEGSERARIASMEPRMEGTADIREVEDAAKVRGLSRVPPDPTRDGVPDFRRTTRDLPDPRANPSRLRHHPPVSHRDSTGEAQGAPRAGRGVPLRRERGARPVRPNPPPDFKPPARGAEIFHA